MSEENISPDKRMKRNYEDRTRFYLPRRTYTILRLDGKSFHSYTAKNGIEKPFDEYFMSRMDLTAKFLCANMQGSQFSYNQSDEISILLCDFKNIHSEAWFDGNIQKMVSVASAMASSFFNSIPNGFVGSNPYSHIKDQTFGDVNDWLMEADEKLAFFDARVFTIPDKVEVYNYFNWRLRNWERNSLHMLASKYYSHKEIKGKKKEELHEMIHEAGDNWANQDEAIKRGRICSKHLGDMWGIYPMMDLRSPEDKNKFMKLIPEYGY